jgi:quinol monooxygenase YgiN
MSVVVVATAIPAPGHRDEVVAAFEKVIPTVHAEDEGCELYALHEGEDRLVMVEKWTSLEATARGPR